MKKRNRRRLYLVAFFLPIFAITLFFIYGFFVNVQKANGTLIVEAESTYGNDSAYIHVSATVNGITKTTPFNVTLPAGTYTVTYSSLNWYYPPANRTVPVPGGVTSWAVGTFTPVPVNIAITAAGFNTTSVKAKAGTTPVVWVNQSAQAVQITSSVLNVVIAPGTSYYYVFKSAGSYNVDLLGGSGNMIVNVS